MKYSIIFLVTLIVLIGTHSVLAAFCFGNKVPLASDSSNTCLDNHCSINVNISSKFFCKIDGCTCKFGYLRNSVGKCVLPCDCQQVSSCSPNETLTYSTSVNCPLICPLPIQRLDPPKNCTAYEHTAVPTCDCDSGYLRTTAGECVLEVDCPKYP